MKLIRFGDLSHEKPGVILNDNKMIDVEAFGEDYDENFFGSDGLIRLQQWLKHNQAKCPEIDNNQRIAASVKKPSKLICIGLNYRDHARESNMKLPQEPILFFKATSAIVGPYDDLLLPEGSQKTDWEVELAVVIGKTARYIEEREAIHYIAGYVLHNDYSERQFQLEKGGQWVKGKSADTFAPLGPYLATTYEILDSQQLAIWLKVNDQIKQQSNTQEMIFSIPYLISYISRFMTLLPGDVISTGTPAGVGMGMKPPAYLQEGDVVEYGISGLGISKQHVRAFRKNIH